MSHQGRFDGLTVDQFHARFAGTFELDDYDAMYQGLDGEVMFVVVAKVKGASITETPVGDVRRTNTLAVKQVAMVRKAEAREELADIYGLELPLTLPGVLEATASSAPAASPEATPVLTAVETDEDEDDGEARVPVGGAAANDDMLARFLETGS